MELAKLVILVSESLAIMARFIFLIDLECN